MGDGGAGAEARRARREEEARQTRIKQGTTRVREKFGEKFNNKYYADLMGAMNLRYDDDVKRQYDDAFSQMQAALQRAGLGDSSVAAKRTGLAKEAYDHSLGDVERAKTSTLQQRRQDVAASENSVINQLTTTADQNAAFANAESQIKANYEQPQFPVLGQLFTDFSAGLASQAEAERQGNNRYNLGVGRLGGSMQRYFKNISGGN